MFYYRILVLISVFLISFAAFAKQVADKSYTPSIETPRFASKSGPVVYVDQAHKNMHTLKDKYAGFARLLEADGYRLASGKKAFDLKYLSGVDVMVISNATPPSKKSVSAFKQTEIEALKQWVFSGGSLLLIADHSPFPVYADSLASVFGFKFVNGIAFGAAKVKGIYTFKVSDGSLSMSEFKTDKSKNFVNASFMTFTGSAFVPPKEAVNVLRFGADSWISLVPNGDFSAVKQAEKYSIEGLSQGALLKYGKGKVAVFGEAAAFTSQKSGKRKMGLHAEGAEGNEAFILALMIWLTGK